MPFQKGNKLSPGRPRRSIEEKRLKELRRKVTTAEWNEIIDKVIALAKRGEKWAVEFLAGYLIGKPAQTVDVGFDNKLEIVVTHADDIETTNTASETG